MEKNISPENIKMYISWRDEFLKIIGKKICWECNDPCKDKMAINYEDPLNCECRCDRVNNLITTASVLDADIKLLSDSTN